MTMARKPVPIDRDKLRAAVRMLGKVLAEVEGA
jgi:hypothetical protein